MKLFKRKKKLIDLVLLIAAFVSFYLGNFLSLTLTQKVLLGILLFLFILVLGLTPKSDTEEDLIEEQDERNQYITLKCASKAFEITQYISFLTILACLIGFGLTKEFAFVWILIGAAIPYGIARISFIVFSFRYDKP